MRKGLLMRRTASFTLIALATFAGGSTAAVAAPAGPNQARPVISLQRAPLQAGGQTGRMTTGINAWRPIKGACIICWNTGR